VEEVLGVSCFCPQHSLQLGRMLRSDLQAHVCRERRL